jgi:tRNA threonylcarbamoyladenosine biosynthesis protein TsaE
MPELQITTNSPEETEELAMQIARRLHGGEVIELMSDLGGGKTTFTRGLAAGVDSKDAVASPTFTISREYTGGRLHLYHFDFYRLGEAGIVADEIAEVVGDPEGVVIVEWAEVVQHVLPEERLHITITASNEQQREFTIQFPDSLAYLMENM